MSFYMGGCWSWFTDSGCSELKNSPKFEPVSWLATNEATNPRPEPWPSLRAVANGHFKRICWHIGFSGHTRSEGRFPK